MISSAAGPEWFMKGNPTEIQKPKIQCGLGKPRHLKPDGRLAAGGEISCIGKDENS
jgi:hypothetical protein